MHKKALTAIITTLILVVTLITSASASCYGAATVTGNSVNVRSMASSDSSVVTTANSGETVIIEGNMNGFHKVVIGGREGWIADQYLSFMNEADGNFGTAYVTGSDVNLRSAPSTSGSVVAKCASGTAVSVIGVSGTWLKVSANGQQGYISGDYVSFTGASSNASASGTAVASGTNNDSSSVRYIKGDSVRLRSAPSTSSEVLGTYNAGTAVTLLGTSNGWAYVSVDGKTGYVSASYLCYSLEGLNNSQTTQTTSAKTGYIRGNNVRVRSAASTSSEILGTYSNGTKVTILGTEGSWTKITVDGKIGYVASTYVSESDTSSSSSKSSSSAASTSNGVTGQMVADKACEYVGYPYVYGGSDPSGFDCSGFVKYIYGLFGITLDRTAEQQASNGIAVDRANLIPGDIICFSYGSGYIGHVGIYIGNGQFVHAGNSSTGVIITDLNSSSYNDRVAACRRIIY